jgi:hypothetical protein
MDPQTIAHQLGELGRELDQAVRSLAELEESAVDDEGNFKVAFARAFREGTGSVEDRKQQAIEECDQLWRIWGKAAAAVRMQKEHVKALHARIDVGRTLASTVRAELSLVHAGVGT